jgi:hypothetical protein
MKKAFWADLVTVVLFVVVVHATSPAQPVFRNNFPPEEFAARRARLFEKIGNGVAILEGTTERPGEQPFRQGDPERLQYWMGARKRRRFSCCLPIPRM